MHARPIALFRQTAAKPTDRGGARVTPRQSTLLAIMWFLCFGESDCSLLRFPVLLVLSLPLLLLLIFPACGLALPFPCFTFLADAAAEP